MTAQNIIDLARDLTHVTSNQVTDTQALRYLNIAYHELENEIVQKINENFFWDEFTTDTIAGQNEYVLPISSSTTEGIKKIVSCEIKWKDTDTEYYKIASDTSSNYSQGIDYLKDNLNTSNAFFELKEGSIFLYPKPTESIINGLKVQSIVTLKDLTSSDTEADIFPNQSSLRQFHYALAIGMKQYIYSQQREFGEKDNAINEWEVTKSKIISYLEDRVNTPIIGTLPTDTTLMY